MGEGSEAKILNVPMEKVREHTFEVKIVTWGNQYRHFRPARTQKKKLLANPVGKDERTHSMKQ